jgi:hypothetical protein
MGGMNSAVTLSQWGDDRIRAAIDEAFEILATGNGFILYPVDNIMCELPWDRTELILDQYKKHW